MLDDQLKLEKTISVPVDLHMFNLICKLARADGVAKTIVVRRALNKCYRSNFELLEE